MQAAFFLDRDDVINVDSGYVHQHEDFQYMEEQAPIDRAYFSPYYPTEGVRIYKREHIARKPHLGMIFQAQRELDISLLGSILIGDKHSDIQAGLAAEVGTNISMQTERGGSSPEAGDYLQIRVLCEALPLLASQHQRCFQ